jgi:hypothetical protein
VGKQLGRKNAPATQEAPSGGALNDVLGSILGGMAGGNKSLGTVLGNALGSRRARSSADCSARSRPAPSGRSRRAVFVVRAGAF